MRSGFKKYYRIGFMTAIGRSNWTESVKNNMAPHKELLQSNEIKALQEIFASDDSGDSPDGMNFNPVTPVRLSAGSAADLRPEGQGGS